MDDGSDSTSIAAPKPVCLRERVTRSSFMLSTSLLHQIETRELHLLRLHHNIARLGRIFTPPPIYVTMLPLCSVERLGLSWGAYLSVPVGLVSKSYLHCHSEPVEEGN